MILVLGAPGWPGGAPRAGVRGFLVVGGWRVGLVNPSGEGGDLGGRSNDLVDPRPRVGQPEMPSPAGPGESGRDVQHPVAEQLRLGFGEVAREGEEPEPGGEVGGDRDDVAGWPGRGGPGRAASGSGAASARLWRGRPGGRGAGARR